VEDDCIWERSHIPARGNAGFHQLCPAIRFNPLVCRHHLTALAMGLRNATVRRIALPDLTTTVLTLTITGVAADSSLAGGSDPRWQRRVMSILLMFAGAVVGALLLRHSLALPLGLATASAVCGVAVFYGSRPLERAETPISAKVPNEAQPNPTSARTNQD
jgi:uncharacterized membrane protein YoaK (UPF0700 family)